MLPLILFALFILLGVARLCPDTAMGRHLVKTFIEGPARWLERPRLSHVLAAVALGLLLFAAPELSAVAAGLDMQLLIDLTLAASIAIAQIGFRHIRVLAHKTMRAVTASMRNNRRAVRIRRTRPPRADSGDGDPAPAPAFA